jgi:DNA mismatch endonuclease (patch repair protein)
MSRIRSRDTLPELIVRSAIHRLGFRFRIHVKNLPGTPDIVLPKYKSIILVHGCFWHRHPQCKYAYTPKSRQDFWSKKFEANRLRDQLVLKDLRKLGWSVITVWECETKNGSFVWRVLRELNNKI